MTRKTIPPLLILLIGAGAWDQTPLRAAEGGDLDFFESKIRPILAEHCYECHGRGEELKGGLRLDLKAGWSEGGKSGPAVIPGQPDASLLIRAVRYHDPDLKMPPKDKKLTDEQIALLEQWVSMGAPDPREGEFVRPDPARDHWAFLPVQNPDPPETKNKRWPATGLDAFVLARLEEHHLGPSPRADERTLIRRVFNDVIGLPPTPQEVVAFEQDGSAEAYERLVDDLLSRPQYGERWARHWLDVARYADTKGYVFEEERGYAFAYTYRDYVVSAFNRDLPYDRFLIEQLAADKLDLGEDKTPLAAMGYLTLGRRFLNNQQDIIDDRIDVVTRGMMGLTVACARCHDHKFDPIPTADYYSLYGVFASSDEPGEKPLLGTKPPEYEAYQVEHEKRVKAREDHIEKTNREIRRTLNASVGDYLFAAHDAAAEADRNRQELLAKNRSLHFSVLSRWMKSMEAWQATNHPVFVPWNELRKNTTGSDADITEAYAALVSRQSSEDAIAINPLVWQSITNEPPATLKQLADRYTGVFQSVADQHADAPGKGNEADRPGGWTAVSELMFAEGAPNRLDDGELRRLYNVEQGQRVRALQREIEKLDSEHPGAPPRAMVLVDKETPYDPHIFKRGQPGLQGDAVPRQFLEILSGPDRKPFENGSGRLEMAAAIASTNNPMTARVLVNRMWSYYFDQPLVDTPSDFGVRSDPPTHPLLLDHLAWKFMHEDGWSLKKLHRRILLSATYQQSSRDNPAFRAIDPGNRYYWRQNRKRLDFEAMRDGILAVSGNLDPAIGGQAVRIDEANYSPRRSLYGYIDRQNLPGLFRTFDLASPDTTSPRRFTTTVPQQALFLLNSPFIARQSRELVRELGGQEVDDRRLVEAIYQTVLQRSPAPAELTDALQFLKQEAARPVSEPAPPDWQYGFGRHDAATDRVVSFTPFKKFKDGQWQSGDSVPDPDHGWALLTKDGGHPGNDPDHAVIRRWTAPAGGSVSLVGKIRHESDQGDGVQARLVSSRSGTAGEWTVHNGAEDTHLGTINVEPGDALDLVVGCRTGPGFDSFKWEATLRYEADASTSPPRTEWNTARQFSGPKDLPQPLNARERFAQVLLVSNELFFID